MRLSATILAQRRALHDNLEPEVGGEQAFHPARVDQSVENSSKSCLLLINIPLPLNQTPSASSKESFLVWFCPLGAACQSPMKPPTYWTPTGQHNAHHVRTADHVQLRTYTCTRNTSMTWNVRSERVATEGAADCTRGTLESFR